jgi:hypothetical protein
MALDTERLAGTDPSHSRVRAGPSEKLRNERPGIIVLNQMMSQQSGRLVGIGSCPPPGRQMTDSEPQCGRQPDEGVPTRPIDDVDVGVYLRDVEIHPYGSARAVAG